MNHNTYSYKKIQLNPSSVGLLETFYSSIKPRELFAFKKKLAGPGNFGGGEEGASVLVRFETYDFERIDLVSHISWCVHFNIVRYQGRVCEGRGWTSSNLTKEIEFIMDRLPDKDRSKGDPVDFKITKSSLENVHADVMRTLPDFHFEGRFRPQAVFGELTAHR